MDRRRHKADNAHDTLEEMTLRLSSLEAERDAKRKRVKALFARRKSLELEIKSIHVEMKETEESMMDLDESIETLETELHSDYNRQQQQQQLQLAVKKEQGMECLDADTIKMTQNDTQNDDFLTEPMTMTMRGEDILTDPQTQQPFENDDTYHPSYFPAPTYRPSSKAASVGPLELVTARQKKENLPGNLNPTMKQGTLDHNITQCKPKASSLPQTLAHSSVLASDVARMPSNDLNACFAADNFPWSQQVMHLLRNTFRIQSFRDNQREIINATLAQEDVFVLMRTGGGKSLTYQLPALLEGKGHARKVTFVISPLLSLIQDQEDQMNQFAPGSAVSFTSGVGAAEHTRRWDLVRDASQGVCLVLITPEKVYKSKRLQNELEKLYSQGM
jgi:hypothetical protein